MMDKSCCGTGGWAGKWDPFTRLCYQFGMLLGVDEFAQEQGYLVTKHRLSQRLSVGFGLVWGKPVVVDDTKGTLTVGPLYALDELGRELWVKDPCTIDLNGWLRENPEVDDKTPIYVTIAYAPCCVAPIPAVAAPCDDSASPTMPSRVRESISVCLGRDLPPAAIDLSDTPPPSKTDPDQAARWKTFVQLLSDDAARPLLLATVTSKPVNRADTTNVQNLSVLTQNDALPRITIVLGAPVSAFALAKTPAPLVGEEDAAAFRVVAVDLDTATKELTVRFNLAPAAATKDSFKVQMYAVPAAGTFAAPTALVNGAPKFDASDNQLLRVPLTALPDKGKPVRVTVAGAGDAAVLGWDGRALLAVNNGADFVFTFTP
jgi:hypothetical protein